jgi:hypothetical protein
MADEITNEITNQISKNEIFPNNLIQQIQLNKPDGKYKVTDIDMGGCIAHFKDGKFVQYDIYNVRHELYLVWTFDYDDKMTIYREFPSLNIPREIFHDRVNGRYDKNQQEKFRKSFNKMLSDNLNQSIQLENKVETVTNCVTCGTAMVKCKDGEMVYYCKCQTSYIWRMWNFVKRPFTS